MICKKYLICLPLIISLLAGCSGNKKFSRKIEIFQPRQQLFHGQPQNSPHISGVTTTGLKLLYEKKIKGSVDSPILIDDRYIAFNTTRRRFLIFDQKTGRKIFQTKNRTGMALDPLIADSLVVLVYKAVEGRINVINLFNRKTIYERNVKEIRSGPIKVNNSLIFGTTEGILALDFPQLKTKWQLDLDGIVNKTPISDEKAIYYVQGGNSIGAVEIDDGSVIWQRQIDDDIVSQLSCGEYLYVGTDNGELLALDKNSGEIAWSYAVGSSFRGHVAEVDQKVYFGCGNGELNCVDNNDGRLVWKYLTEGTITASPVVIGSSVYIGSHDCHLYRIDRLSGQLLGKRELEGQVKYAVAPGKSVIFAACRNNRIYCFEGE